MPEVPVQEPMSHGGQRKGAGRKPLQDGSITKSYKLTPRHVGMLDQYRQTKGLATASEALRHLIESWST